MYKNDLRGVFTSDFRVTNSWIITNGFRLFGVSNCVSLRESDNWTEPAFISVSSVGLLELNCRLWAKSFPSELDFLLMGVLTKSALSCNGVKFNFDCLALVGLEDDLKTLDKFKCSLNDFKKLTLWPKLNFRT